MNLASVSDHRPQPRNCAPITTHPSVEICKIGTFMSRFPGRGRARGAQTPRNASGCALVRGLRTRPAVKSAPIWFALLLAAAAVGCGSDPNTRPTPGCASGTICTWAGTGDPAFYGDGLDRREAMLYWPMDLAFAPDGRAYVLDWQNHRVRRVNPDDTFETVLGTDDVGDGPDTGNERTSPGVAGTDCNLNHPTDVTFDQNGVVIVAAWHNHKIRRLDPASGMEDVVSGAGPGFTGDGMPALGALLNQPKSVVISKNTGVLYLADTRNFRIRSIGTDGVINTVVGSATAGFAGDGGPPLQAQLKFQMVSDNPEPGGGLAIDDQDRLYIVDTENQRIRRVDFAANIIETVAGNGTPGFSGDGGPATDASLAWPRDVALGPDGKLYIADTDNHRVRAVDLASGVIDTVVGDGNPRFWGDGGTPAQASLQRPWGITFDAAGNLYIADTFNNRIRKVMP
jgi:sugar lactone lactonase YvrE